MPNNDLTDLNLILDRSGSMRRICDDMEGGIKTFIAEQAKQPGILKVSLYQFDDQYEVAFEGVSPDKADVKLIPRGNTALNDAIGNTINRVGARLAALPEEQRPGCVILLVITDGQENASKEFSGKQIAEMVAHQHDAYKWQFAYLGSDASTFTAAKSLNFGVTRGYQASAKGTKGLMNSTSRGVSAYRTSRSRGLNNDLAIDDKD